MEELLCVDSVLLIKLNAKVRNNKREKGKKGMVLLK